MKMSGGLYIVPTPIGNLEDITLRALRVLRECDLVVCEDTRRSSKLMLHFKIFKPLMSYYSYNEYHKVGRVIDKLVAGEKVVLISDAGTPTISDPGYILVKAAIEKAIKIEVLPGASAVTTALVGSGLPTNGFVFCGFLKKKSNKIREEFAKFLNLKKTIIFYESPRRILKTMGVCLEVFGENARICVAREITKKFEEFIRGSIAEVLGSIKKRHKMLGEIVVLVYPEIDRNCG
jgi:16S rRNA (cytidine1402-2'-O)-methyltransferase